MSLLLQITTAATDSLAAVTPATEETLSLFDLALKGGPIMVPIALCSVIAVYIIFERYFLFGNRQKMIRIL